VEDDPTARRPLPSGPGGRGGLQRTFTNPEEGMAGRGGGRGMPGRGMAGRGMGGRMGRGGGLATMRSAALRGSGGRGAGMMAQRSMSSRFLGAVAGSSRALFGGQFEEEEEEEPPSTIMYLGREFDVKDLFDEDWIEDALEEEEAAKQEFFNKKFKKQTSR